MKPRKRAIINAMVAAKDMVGINGNKLHALPHDAVTRLMKKYNRYVKAQDESK